MFLYPKQRAPSYILFSLKGMNEQGEKPSALKNKYAGPSGLAFYFSLAVCSLELCYNDYKILTKYGEFRYSAKWYLWISIVT